jgi:hypothetical protein
VTNSSSRPISVTLPVVGNNCWRQLNLNVNINPVDPAPRLKQAPHKKPCPLAPKRPA